MQGQFLNCHAETIPARLSNDHEPSSHEDLCWNYARFQPRFDPLLTESCFPERIHADSRTKRSHSYGLLFNLASQNEKSPVQENLHAFIHRFIPIKYPEKNCWLLTKMTRFVLSLVLSFPSFMRLQTALPRVCIARLRLVLQSRLRAYRHLVVLIGTRRFRPTLAFRPPVTLDIISTESAEYMDALQRAVFREGSFQRVSS